MPDLMIDRLNELCKTPSRILRKYREQDLGVDGAHLYYIDNGSDILFVAHIDSVQAPEWTKTFGGRFYSPVVDDKIGIHIALNILPAMNIGVDVLLTDNEEIARSTGSSFVTHKNYNWMLSFDRGGTDNVMYQYETPELVGALKKHKLRVGKGTYSCIVDMDHMGCVGINFGSAMYDYHSRHAFVDLSDLEKQLEKFRGFYEEHKSTVFDVPAYTKPASRLSYSEWYKGYDFYDTTEEDGEYDEIIECIYCGDYVFKIDAKEDTYHDGYVCDNCFTYYEYLVERVP